MGMRMTLARPRELNGFPEGSRPLLPRGFYSPTVGSSKPRGSRKKGDSVVSACLNQQRHASCNFAWDPLFKSTRINPNIHDITAASFWSHRLLGGFPSLLWCATNAGAICGHIRGSGIPLKISFSSRVAIPAYGSQLPTSAPVFTAANAHNHSFSLHPTAIYTERICIANFAVQFLPFWPW